MKKPIIAGLFTGLIMLATGMIISGLALVIFPSLKEEFMNAALFRPWTDPAMLLYFTHPFLVGIFLAWIWSRTQVLFAPGSVFTNGLRFGMLYWLFSIAGMIMTYSSFPVSFGMICMWTATNFFQAFFAGLFLARIIRNEKHT